MALRLSTGIRTAMLSAGGIGTGGTGGLKTLLDGGVMDIFTGSQPTSADYVETGTKLVRISSTSGTRVFNGAEGTDGLRFGTAAAGVLPRTNPAWTGVVSVAGVAGWFRLYGTASTSGTSATSWRIDGAVGVSGADLNLSHTDLVVDSVLTISTFNITQPAE
jgi:hypothetical protein